MRIRPLQTCDESEWKRMRVDLWPKCSEDTHVRDMEEIANSEFVAVFVAEWQPGQLVGFIEVGIHPFLDGGQAHSVASIDGWYVDDDFRGRGIGARLIEAAEQCAEANECVAITSDCEIQNEIGFRAHQALGFSETLRLIHFSKPLNGSERLDASESAIRHSP